MKQLPKFMIAHNVAAEPNAIYVVHTQYPAFIAQAIPRTGDIEDVTMLYKQYPIATRTKCIDGIWYIVAVIKWYDIYPDAIYPDDIYPDDIQYDVDRIAKLVSRIGDWFFNYIKTLPNENKTGF